MICTPRVPVRCDGPGCRAEVWVDMSKVGDFWSTDSIASDLKSYGWRLIERPEATLCPRCVERWRWHLPVEQKGDGPA